MVVVSAQCLPCVPSELPGCVTAFHAEDSVVPNNSADRGDA
jgi:hypothetical protein